MAPYQRILLVRHTADPAVYHENVQDLYERPNITVCSCPEFSVQCDARGSNRLQELKQSLIHLTESKNLQGVE